MKRTAVLFVACALVASATFRSAAQGPPAGSESYERLPQGPGRDVLISACVPCHDPQRSASLRLTREGWEGVIQNMMARGMKATDEEQAAILEYLTTHFLGEAPRPININTAEQIDLEAVLSLLRGEAAAVIAYRDKHGPFNTVEELKNVPGLDYAKIEKVKDRVVAIVLGSR